MLHNNFSLKNFKVIHIGHQILALTCAMLLVAGMAASALALANLHCISTLYKTRNRRYSSSCVGDTFFCLKYFKTPLTPPPLDFDFTLPKPVELSGVVAIELAASCSDRPGDSAHADAENLATAAPPFVTPKPPRPPRCKNLAKPCSFLSCGFVFEMLGLISSKVFDFSSSFALAL